MKKLGVVLLACLFLLTASGVFALTAIDISPELEGYIISSAEKMGITQDQITKILNNKNNNNNTTSTTKRIRRRSRKTINWTWYVK